MKKHLAWLAYASLCMTVPAGSHSMGEPASPAAQQATSASGSTVEGDGMSNLEKAFWDCDYAATHRMLDIGEAGDCSVITEDVRRSFRDFAGMLKWWQRNKAAEHRSRDRSVGLAP